MKIDLDQVKLVAAEKNNKDHKVGIWKVFNANIKYFYSTDKPVSLEEHSQWWETIFEKEWIFVIIYKSTVCGYIRLTKVQTKTKNEHEISIALSDDYQNSGIGTYAYDLFEKQMKNNGITKLIARTKPNNIKGQKFFEKNKFYKEKITYIKDLNT